MAQDLQSQLDSKRAELDETRQQEGVLSTEIAHYTDRLNQLAGEVATLRNREAIVQVQLEEVKARLRRERHHLEVLRDRLQRSLRILGQRLVAIYRSDEPDALTVILNSDGFDDMLKRYEYLRRIEEQDASIVGRVRDLRDETQATVERIEAARDEIAARKAELERTRMALEAREAELDAVRDRKQGALAEVQATEERLEGDVGELADQIQAELQAVQSTATTPLPAGPIQGESASGFIWPVNGPVVSPFGMRWGRLHAGIDIAVPSGTPIRASKSGTIALAAPYGGYGNYTCIDHGSGISSCYAHQSSFAVTSGSVSQGQVIGYVGCTGHCFGDHLHFEIRVNGAPTDPLGYL
ncbi:MAG TPA: peptidoglycan DD-metalloendopeptidase family protein [Solirubrobacterales bacterium]|nr:peptidoglycan DD-metalloendopeptidase family protein [Solirubrobacterales bacterium]